MQNELKWQYHNHAMIPSIAPHDIVDESQLKSASFWKPAEGYPLLARWTTDFDCQEQTNWWYIIKDTPFDIMSINTKYRTKIKRGLKAFEIRIVEPAIYAEELYQVQLEAFSSYPAKYRPRIDHNQFVACLCDKRKGTIFAAFSKDDNSIEGFMCVMIHESYLLLSMSGAKPSQERKQLNAALVYGILDYFSKELAEGIYVVDGERSILHETLFQDYLEKYFGFRKAYCRLHIQYRQGIKQIVACLYPIRGLLKPLSGVKPFCQINSVLKMEEIVRHAVTPADVS